MIVKERNFPALKGILFPKIGGYLSPKTEGRCFPFTDKTGMGRGDRVSIVKRLSFQHTKCKHNYMKVHYNGISQKSFHTKDLRPNGRNYLRTPPLEDRGFKILRRDDFYSRIKKLVKPSVKSLGEQRHCQTCESQKCISSHTSSP